MVETKDATDFIIEHLNQTLSLNHMPFSLSLHPASSSEPTTEVSTVSGNGPIH
jgi:hypothetical protein